MPFIIKFWLIKLFTKPIITVIALFMYLVNPKRVTKDLCIDLIKDEGEDLKEFKFTTSDLTLIEIVKNVDVNLIVENRELRWTLFKFWWKWFIQMCTNENYKRLVE
jgi:hypothetical protein